MSPKLTVKTDKRQMAKIFLQYMKNGDYTDEIWDLLWKGPEIGLGRRQTRPTCGVR